MRNFKIVGIFLAIFLLAQSCGFGGPAGGGIYKSEDTGETWGVSDKLARDSELSLGPVHSIGVEVDEVNPKNVYLIATTSGLYKSQDQGTTWTGILQNAEIMAVSVNPKNNSEIFAGGRVGGLAKLFRSQDEGQTWIEVFSESRGDNTFVSAVEVMPNSPEVILIGLSTGEIVRSLNSGLSWNLLSTLVGRVMKITASENQSSVVTALSLKNGLYRSNNGGAEWSNITGSVKASQYLDFESVKTNGSAYYLSTVKGLYRTGDVGGTWQQLELPSHQSSTAVSAVTVNQSKPSEIYAVIELTVYKSTDAGITWQTRIISAVGTVRDIMIDPAEPNIMYAALGLPL
ncbi:MAG: hypothetical protein COT91_05215 [Candidatus Doudnabacteria bacterium CG10_big_fil_rev_8_21_14_0_10_41_10]|uniref:Sortilin N-terminal domain-containing protein n=1 Tax=Candidatus Doudnabacteria bacterium CG10_big_fil_rev_8_21_14_0_10_41_10 TaxID=1974551 RepID=A0A2H0VCA1_9BACT|nr:MAG: hypothetical protein COT91_05215 [Candidatus Doudnabacteria bacterium CG10_big_fil_rev_8_21_14_0_10_41_10]